MAVFKPEEAKPARAMAEMIALGLEARGGNRNWVTAQEIRHFADAMTGIDRKAIRETTETEAAGVLGQK